MTKKIIITTTILLCTIFACTYSFAANELMDAANGVRNVVGGVENGIENMAKDATGAIKQGTNNIEKTGENITNDVAKGMNNAADTVTNNDNNDRTNDGYTATRTATGIFGTSDTMWTWLILAVVAVVIIGLVWYYTMQKNNTNGDY